MTPRAQSLALSELPLDPDNPILTEAPFTDAALALFDDGLAGRTASNQVLDITGGLTSRPYVLEDDDGDPDRAIVWDCQIDATFWKDVDTSEREDVTGKNPFRRTFGSAPPELAAETKNSCSSTTQSKKGQARRSRAVLVFGQMN